MHFNELRDVVEQQMEIIEKLTERHAGTSYHSGKVMPLPLGLMTLNSRALEDIKYEVNKQPVVLAFPKNSDHVFCRINDKST